MTEILCRLLNDGTCQFDRIELNGNDLPIDIQNLIREDKKYGYLTPVDGFVTYRVTDGDKEITRSEVGYLVRLALQQYQLKFDVKFRPAKRDEKEMLNIGFSDVTTDKYMTGSTLAYHGYPNGALRGICRINRNYFFTVHGRRLNLHEIDPEHYPDPEKAKSAPTWDLDMILMHEVGHGIFGLQHDGQSNTVMAALYPHMSEYLDPRTISRIEAKGVRRRPVKTKREELRYKQWLEYKLENFPIWLKR